jgi:hypothetical protein
MIPAGNPPPRPALRGLPLYVLIDPYTADYPDHDIDLAQCTSFDCLRALRSDAWNGRDVFLADGDDPVAHVHRLPYLVSLKDADDALIDALTEAALAEHRAALDGEQQPYRIGALIETWMAPPDLMRRLQKMWAYRPNADNLRYLRIAERRIFEGLTHLFDPAMLARWLGPIARWHFTGRAMAWLTVLGDADADGKWYSDTGFGMRRTVDPQRALEAAALHVSPQQHWRLRDHEAVSRALDDWQRQGRAIDAHAYELAWAGIDEAVRHGLAGPKDKGAFACRWMRNPACAGQSPVREALARSRTLEQPFAEVLAEIEALNDHPAGIDPA